MTAKVTRLIHALEQLQDVDYEDPVAARKYDALADAALRLIFHIGREQIPFTTEHKSAVAKNLPKALRSIQINVEAHGFEFRSRINTLILKKRSALQFLIDTYGSFTTTRPQTLSNIFEQRNLRETIGILDEIIEKFQSVSGSDDEHSGADSDRDFPGIPSSHTWWF